MMYTYNAMNKRQAAEIEAFTGCINIYHDKYQ